MTEPNPWAAPGDERAPRGQGSWGAPPPPGWQPVPPQGQPGYQWPPYYQPPPDQWGRPQQWGPPQPYPAWELPAAFAYWGSPPKPPRRGLGKSGVALLMAIVVLIVSGVASAAIRHERVETDRLARVRAQLARELPGLKAFVERERGLRFRREVDVELLDDDAFVERLFSGDSTSVEPTEPPDTGATLYALRLLDDRDALDDALDDAFAETVQGFYDFDSKQLVIRGRSLNPLTRLVLVHELTHAVQDQHFDLAKMDFEGRTDESELGWTSLVEGDANRVDEAYRESLSAGDQARLEELEEEQYEDIGDAAPDVVYALLGFPYAIGPDFVRAVLQKSGQPGLDRAFRSPPSTSEHILDPETYLTGDKPVAVPKPRVDAKVIDEGALGQLGLGLMLGEGETDEVTSPAAEGWSGDHYVTYERGGQVCLRADIVMETARDRDELLAGLHGQFTSGLSPRGSTELRLETCRG